MCEESYYQVMMRSMYMSCEQCYFDLPSNEQSICRVYSEVRSPGKYAPLPIPIIVSVCSVYIFSRRVVRLVKWPSIWYTTCASGRKGVTLQSSTSTAQSRQADGRSSNDLTISLCCEITFNLPIEASFFWIAGFRGSAVESKISIFSCQGFGIIDFFFLF